MEEPTIIRNFSRRLFLIVYRKTPERKYCGIVFYGKVAPHTRLVKNTSKTTRHIIIQVCFCIIFYSLSKKYKITRWLAQVADMCIHRYSFARVWYRARLRGPPRSQFDRHCSLCVNIVNRRGCIAACACNSIYIQKVTDRHHSFLITHTTRAALFMLG